MSEGDANRLVPGPRLSWLAAVCGIAGLVVSIVVPILAYKGAIETLRLLFLVALPTVCLTIVLCYVLGVAFRDLKAFSEQLEETREHTAENYNNLVDRIEQLEGSNRVATRILELARDLNDQVSNIRHVPTETTIFDFSHSVCRDLARLLSESLGAACRACVKAVDDSLQEASVRTLARSGGLLRSDLVPAPIAQNTDFKVLRDQKKKVWFCEDIRALEDYQNTSNMPAYRSTIVWPIIVRPTLPTAADFTPVVAYLCVDSEMPSLFDEERHVPLGWVISDALARLYEAKEFYSNPPKEGT